MKNRELVSYAILSVNYDSKKEYLSNFEPFILEIIKKDNPENIASSDIQEGLHNEFGLSIPNNVIKTMCGKLAEKGFLFKQKINGFSDKYTYSPDYSKIDEVNLKRKSTKMNKAFDELISKYLEYLNVEFSIELCEDEAIAQINAFIKENNLNLISNEIMIDEKSTEELNFLVGKFVNYIHQSDKDKYNVFLDIVKGNMLSEALYYNDSGNFKKKFNGSKFYFDTSFLMYALGYSGEQRKKPCIELLDLLKKNGAELYCFEHNIIEVIGILTWSKHNLNSGKDSHNTIEYFRENSIDKEGIELIISDLEYTIEDTLGLSISGSVEYDHSDYSNVIDYNGMLQYLKDNIHYNKDESLDNDVESIASIMRLRKRKQPTNIEDCGAVFVTTNGKLCRTIKDYFESQGNLGIPPILTDSVVTNLVWLKNPELYPDLPSLRLVADCFAAINPSDRLWNKYIDKIEKMIAQGEIVSENAIVTLRYLPDAKKVLMDKTMGDENAITDGTAKDVLEEIEKQNNAALESAREEEREKSAIKLQEEKQKGKMLEKSIHEEKEKNNKIFLSLQESAKKQVLTFKYLAYGIICLFFFLICLFSLELISIHKTIQILISIGAAVVLPVVNLILKFFDIDFLSNIKKVEAQHIEKKCKKKCLKLGVDYEESIKFLNSEIGKD